MLRSEVFGLQRFRECELIHGRWAMLACLGALVQEGVTGDSWVAAQTLVSCSCGHAGNACLLIELASLSAVCSSLVLAAYRSIFVLRDKLPGCTGHT